jgi:hypothetical protein
MEEMKGRMRDDQETEKGISLLSPEMNGNDCSIPCPKESKVSPDVS